MKYDREKMSQHFWYMLQTMHNLPELDNMGKDELNEFDTQFASFLTENTDLLTQRGRGKLNIGMLCATCGLEKSVMVALGNKEASLQGDEMLNNIGMWAANYGMIDATKMALQNKEASLQKNKFGRTIGIECCMSSFKTMKECALEAMKNEEAMKIDDNNRKTMKQYFDNNSSFGNYAKNDKGMNF